jgi:hypothetical protein
MKLIISLQRMGDGSYAGFGKGFTLEDDHACCTATGYGTLADIDDKRNHQTIVGRKSKRAKLELESQKKNSSVRMLSEDFAYAARTI